MNKYRLFLLLIFIIVFVWSGINPPSLSYWALESIPVILAIVVLFILERYIKLSNISYTFLLAYIILPLITSHYGVTQVPWGYEIGRFFGSSLNLYDKLTHFSFGFLVFYPLQEIVIHLNKNYDKESLWNYYISLSTLFALSGIYEVFEWVASLTVNPFLAASFYGSTDLFDGQKDMVIMMIGALMMAIVLFLIRKYKNNK
jgi:putative membrane protein